MAPLKTLEGVEVYIEVDGYRLPEHQDTTLEEEDDTIVRYVESETGQTFVIHFAVAQGTGIVGDALRFRVQIDGTSMGGRFVYKKDTDKRSRVNTRSGRAVSATRLAPFRFAAIETVSNSERLTTDIERLKSLGCIRIEVSHCHVGQITSWKSHTHRSPSNTIPEKALKGSAVSHQVEFGEEINEGTRLRKSKPIGKPIGAVLLYYRSIAALKSMHIIPRTPSPPPLEDRELDSLSRADLLQMQKYLRELKEKQANAAKIKREASDENPRPRKIARPSRDSVMIEIGEDGGTRESRSLSAATEREVIELD